LEFHPQPQKLGSSTIKKSPAQGIMIDKPCFFRPNLGQLSQKKGKSIDAFGATAAPIATHLPWCSFRSWRSAALSAARAQGLGQRDSTWIIWGYFHF
jgi:hypothetical protein